MNMVSTAEAGKSRRILSDIAPTMLALEYQFRSIRKDPIRFGVNPIPMFFMGEVSTNAIQDTPSQEGIDRCYVIRYPLTDTEVDYQVSQIESQTST